MKRTRAVGMETRVLLALLCLSPFAADACGIGSYRMSDGSHLDIGPAEEGKLRWRTTDGRTGALTQQAKGRWTSTLGWTTKSDGHVVAFDHCGDKGIRFDDLEGQRIPLVQTDTRFEGSGVQLAGRLTMPPGNERVPIVILVHGAEQSSALESYSLQRQFASEGIGVFAYDKRGTGASGGHYTQNYLTLAIDAVHAAREARRLAGVRAGPVGYQGGSQGGWVAPLAARIEPVDFIIVSFGLAVSAYDEDREAIMGDMGRAGFGPEVTALALEVADATAAIIESDFTKGFDDLAMLREKYGKEPWFKALRGNYTGILLSTPPEALKVDGPRLTEGIPLRYDPMPVLEHLDVPQLWALGGEDRDAPPGETLRRLAQLKKQGRPIHTIVYPGADHGMYEFELDAQGERVSTRQPATYLQTMIEFIRAGTLPYRLPP